MENEYGIDEEKQEQIKFWNAEIARCEALGEWEEAAEAEDELKKLCGAKKWDDEAVQMEEDAEMESVGMYSPYD
jgi:hypothetical protein